MRTAEGRTRFSRPEQCDRNFWEDDSGVDRVNAEFAGLTRVGIRPGRLGVWFPIRFIQSGIASPDEPVFRSRKKGGGLQRVAVLRIVKKAAEAAGVRIIFWLASSSGERTLWV